MPGGGRHHDAAHRAVAGVEDVVEALREQRGGLGDRPLHDGDRVRVQVLRQQPRDGRGGRGRHLARLEHDRVAPGQRADDRGQQQLRRVVPGCDDQDDAERVLHGVRRRAAQRGRYGGGLGPQPVGEVLQRVVDLADREVDLGAVRLLAALAEVGVERGGELVTALREQRPQSPELIRAPVEALGPPGTEGGAEAVDGLGCGRHGVLPAMGDCG